MSDTSAGWTLLGILCVGVPLLSILIFAAALHLPGMVEDEPSEPGGDE